MDALFPEAFWAAGCEHTCLTPEEARAQRLWASETVEEFWSIVNEGKPMDEVA